MESNAKKSQPDEDYEEPLLELSTLAPKRPTVTIDENIYELRAAGELGIVEEQELRSEGAEFAKLWGKEDLTANGRKRLKMLLDKMFDRILMAPEEVKAGLSDSQRQRLIMVFTRRKMREELGQMATEANESTTDS